MTREEAEALCRRRAEEEAEGEGPTGQWVVVPAADGFNVARVPMPKRAGEPFIEREAAEHEPPPGEDPRPAHIRNVPGAWG